MSAPRRFAEAYVETTNAGRYGELGALFAEDVVFYAPGQRVIRGRAAISDFYTTFLSDITPQIRISAYLEQGNECVFELEARIRDASRDESAPYVLGAIDHATLDQDGLVARMAVFTK